MSDFTREFSLNQIIIDNFQIGNGLMAETREFEPLDAKRILSRMIREFREFDAQTTRVLTIAPISKERAFHEDVFRRILVLGALILVRSFDDAPASRVLSRLTEVLREFDARTTRTLTIAPISEERAFHEDVFRRVLVLGALIIQREFSDLTSRELYRLTEEVREFTDLTTRTIDRVDSEEREFDALTTRTITAAPIVEEREFDEIKTLREIYRLTEEVREFLDVTTRTIDRLASEEREFDEIKTLREIYRLTTEGRLFNAKTTRTITLEQISEIRQFDDVLTRAIDRLASEERAFDEIDTLRKLYRLTVEDRQFDEIKTLREIYRLTEEVRKFLDVTTRTIDRLTSEEREFDEIKTLREIDRLTIEVRQLLEVLTRSIDRLTEETREFHDVDATRVLSRLQEEFRLFSDVTTRTINIAQITETRQFDDVLTRTITQGAVVETRMFDEIDRLRQISRQPDIKRFFEDITQRTLSREQITQRLFDFVGEAIVRRLDFDGYSNDVELLKQFSSRWMKEEYGALVLSIIQRAAEERREF